ncbi:MAG: hypothetical protein ACQEV7_08755 [Bacillota bacterium]
MHKKLGLRSILEGFLLKKFVNACKKDFMHKNQTFMHETQNKTKKAKSRKVSSCSIPRKIDTLMEQKRPTPKRIGLQHII